MKILALTFFAFLLQFQTQVDAQDQPAKWDAEIRFDGGYLGVQKDYKWGIVDRTGKVILKPTWDGMLYASDGIINVRNTKTKGWGVIDTTGKVILEPVYAHVRYSEGIIVALQKEGGTKIFDKAGKLISIPKISPSLPFSEGVAGYNSSGKWGFIDKYGKVIIPPSPKWDMINIHGRGAFSEGLAGVGKKVGAGRDRKWGYIDKTGKIVIPLQRDEWDIICDFSEGLAGVGMKVGEGRDEMWGSHRKWGYIDKTGKIVIPLQRDEWDIVRNFSEGLACVGKKVGEGKDKKWGFIDKTGKIVIPLQWDEFGKFSDGRAFVKKEGKNFTIDKKGNVIETQH